MTQIKNPITVVQSGGGGGAKVAHGEFTLTSDQSVGYGSGPVVAHNLGQVPDFIMVYTQGPGAANDFLTLCFYRLASTYSQAAFTIQAGAKSGQYNYLLLTTASSDAFITMNANTFQIRGVNNDGKIRSGVKIKWVAGTFE